MSREEFCAALTDAYVKFLREPARPVAPEAPHRSPSGDIELTQAQPGASYARLSFGSDGAVTTGAASATGE